MELLSPEKEKIIENSEISHFKIINESKPENFELLAPKKEEKIEKSKTYNLNILQKKNLDNNLLKYNFSLLQKDNKDSFSIKGNDIDSEITITKRTEYKTIKTVKSKTKNENEEEEEEDFDNDKEKSKYSNLQNYKFFLIILNQLYKNKVYNYKKDLLNRLKINLLKYNEMEILNRKEEEELIEIKKHKTNLEDKNDKSQLFTTTKKSLEFIKEEKPKLTIRKKSLQSFSSNNYSDNYIKTLTDYLKKRIALTNWYNKMMVLKNSKRVRVIGRRIGEGTSKTMITNKTKSFRLNLLRFTLEQIKREVKRRILIKAFLNIQNLQYPSLEFALMKIKKYTEIKFQVMNAYATLIQRYYRYYVEYIKNKRTTVTIIEQSNNTIMETVHYRRRVNYHDYNLRDLFYNFYRKKLVKNIIELLYLKSY